MKLQSHIKAKAIELGFDDVGITTADPVELCHLEHYQQWLTAGGAAEMHYLHRNNDKRFAPAKLLTGAQSIICVALNYRPDAGQLPDNPSVRIARYALYQDYHTFIKERLFQLAQFIKTGAPGGNEGLKFKACVDSVPIAERAIAQRAGLGFIGKNHMLIHPKLGSQILLGELITTLPLTPDSPTPQVSCGDCGACITACPTGALGKDGSFDARKCISYQTIEAPISSPPAKGEYPEGGRGSSYIFGCDTCILACPHENRAPARKNPDLHLHPEWLTLTKDQIQNMTEEDFQTTFKNSSLIRTGLIKLKQNTQASLIQRQE
ncbi:MAG: tRNA epoxyqueuosine(34) reductase QueG [Planctomycetota bacterium]